MEPSDRGHLPSDEDDEGLPLTDGEETMVSADALTRDEPHAADDASEDEAAAVRPDDELKIFPRDSDPTPPLAPGETPIGDLRPEDVMRSGDTMAGVAPRHADPSDVSLKWPLLALLGPIALLTVGSLLFPEQVYWDFVFKYYWGPIKADGLGFHQYTEHGVTAEAGFNLVNTASWAILMGALIFLVDRIVKKIEQPIDLYVVLATLPYMMAGSITRVGTDSGLFDPPFMFLMITPIIYVVIVAIAVLWIIIGHLLKRHSQDVGLDNALYAYGAFLLAVWLLYAIYGHVGTKVNLFAHPLVLLACLALPYAYFWNYTKQSGRFSQVGVMAVFGVAYLLFAISYLVLWHSGNQWGEGAQAEPQYWIYPAMFLAPAIFTGAVFWVTRRMAQKGSSAIVYLLPLNLVLIYAQMMDATMTSVGVDNLTPTSYSEKHVVPGFLIDVVQQSGLPLLSTYAATTVMLTTKFLVSILVVWAIDVYARDDMKAYPSLVGLAKLAIIMVGLAPGTRNAVRMALQV